MSEIYQETKLYSIHCGAPFVNFAKNVKAPVELDFILSFHCDERQEDKSSQIEWEQKETQFERQWDMSDR